MSFHNSPPISKKEKLFAIICVTLAATAVGGTMKAAVEMDNKVQAEYRKTVKKPMGYIDCPGLMANHSFYKIISEHPLKVELDDGSTFIPAESCSVTLY